MTDLAELVRTCEEAARAAGRVLLDFQGQYSVKLKGPGNPVTDADLAAEQVIRQIVEARYPDHGFIGEEGTGSNAGADRPFVWHVDPLDGTLNYVHALPHFCTSIAVAHGNDVLAATVFDPITNECFVASAGGGAWLNGHRLRTSGVASLSDALVAVSMPVYAQRGQRQVEQFLDVMSRCQAFRRLGSAALNLSYIAAGRFDAFWDTKTNSWDVAAGVLLVREAGGIITAADGGPFNLAEPAPLASASTALHDELIEVLRINAQVSN